MAVGPGKYDLECTALLAGTEARLVGLLVLDGDRGSGFSLSARDPADLPEIVSMLRFMADEIERDLRGAET